MTVKIHTLARNLELIDVAPPISGFENFIGAYVLRGDKTAIVDVGPPSGLENLFAGLSELGINPVNINYIFVTHVHVDHNGGIGEAMQKMPNALAVVHEKGKPHLIAPDKLWESTRQTLDEIAFTFGEPKPVPENRIVVAKEGMKIDLGDREIEVLLTPGHASHHLCFWERRERRLFTGDAAGVYSREIDLIRPDMPPPFNLEQAIGSAEKLIKLSPETLCYTHFGCADHAVDKLNSFKERLILWGNIIAEHIKNESDWHTIYEELKEKDKEFKQIDDLHPVQRQAQLSFIKTSIAGYISYFKKYGTGVMNTYK